MDGIIYRTVNRTFAGEIQVFIGSDGILIEDKIRRIVEAPVSGSYIMVKGPTGAGKSTVMCNRYNFMVKEQGVSSEKIVALVLNRSQSEVWSDWTDFKASGRVWVQPFLNFIQEEINTYYPLVLKQCPEIIHRSMRPVFLNFEASRYLISKVVEWHRENREIFQGITAHSEKIAGELVNSLFKAAASGFALEEMNRRLYQSHPEKNDQKQKIYQEAEEILSAYRKKCISLGVYDYSMALELYNNCLLKDDTYLENLQQRVSHLFVDNLEEALPAEVDLIVKILPYLDSCLLGYNYEKGMENGWEGVHQYLEEKLVKNFEVIELPKSYTCSEYMAEFSEMLYVELKNSKPARRLHPMVERIRPTELRSEMLEKIGERINRLIQEEGFAPSDIAVLSTYADPVTEFVIGGYTEKQGIHIHNIAGRNRVIDKELGFCLVVMAQLCHPAYGFIPNTDSLRILMEKLFDLDPIRAMLLSREVYALNAFPSWSTLQLSRHWERFEKNIDREQYEHVCKWVEGYRKQGTPLPIDRFFYRVFLEVFLKDILPLKDIKEVAFLIESAERFTCALDRFTGINGNRGFLEVLLSGMKGTGTREELEYEAEQGAVLLATPQAYLAGPYHHKVIIFTGISSRNWVPRNVRELTNSIVLHKAWNNDRVYTEEVEEENQKNCIASTLRSLIKRCSQKLIIFESVLSANGHENDGLLADYL